MQTRESKKLRKAVERLDTKLNNLRKHRAKIAKYGSSPLLDQIDAGIRVAQETKNETRARIRELEG